MINDESYDIGYMSGWCDRRREDIKKIADKMLEVEDVEILAVLKKLIQEIDELR